MTDARGKLGGQVFSKSRSGAYIATKTIPRNTQSQSQLRVRSELAQISNAWKNLAEDVKEAWTEWAKNHPLTDEFGDKYVLTGRSYYCRNMSRLTSALGVTVDYNIIPRYSAIPSYDFEYYRISNTLETIAGINTTGRRAEYVSYTFFTRPINGVRIPRESDYRIVFGDASTGTQRSRYESYVALFGIPPTDSRVFYRYVLISPSGEVGKVLEGQCVII